MNRVRVVVAAGIIAGFVWLNWWVVPAMGLFHMALSDPPIPDNGYALIFFRDGKSIDATALSMLKTGWSLIWHVWPFVIAGLFAGVMIGYPLGDLARRKFVIDQVEEERFRLNDEVLTAVQERRVITESMVKEARALNTETRAMQEKIDLKEQEIWQMKVTAESELEAAQGFRQRAASLQKKLTKARACIRRLKKKPSPGKQPEAEPWPE